MDLIPACIMGFWNEKAIFESPGFKKIKNPFLVK